MYECDSGVSKFGREGEGGAPFKTLSISQLMESVLLSSHFPSFVVVKVGHHRATFHLPEYGLKLNKFSFSFQAETKTSTLVSEKNP